MFSWENTKQGGKIIKANPHPVLLGTVYGSAGSITSADPGSGPALRAIHCLDSVGSHHSCVSAPSLRAHCATALCSLCLLRRAAKWFELLCVYG